MNIKNLTLAIFFSISIAACGGGGSGSSTDSVGSVSGGSVSESGGTASSSNSAVLVQSISQSNTHGLNGNGRLVAMSYMDTSNTGATTGFKETLNIYRQDAINPDLLLYLASVYLGVDTLYHRVTDIALNDQWAAVTINFNDASQGWVALVPMAGPTYSLSATISFNAALDRAVAMGNWLLVASGTDIALIDITVPSYPVLKSTFALGAGTTSMVALANGFLVITNNGYGYLDVTDSANITFTETANEDIKQSKKAYLIGNKIYIGGPSKYAGKVKIAKLDVTTPGAPTVDIINDQIIGTYFDFGYDGADGYYLQLADSVQLYKEANGVLNLKKSASLATSRYTGNANQLFHAHNGRFYTGTWGVEIYKMP